MEDKILRTLRYFVSPVVDEVYFQLKVLLFCYLSTIANPSDQFWVSPANGLVLA